MSFVKITVRNPLTGAERRVKWRGHIVGGTNKHMAVTKEAVGWGKLREGCRYVPTHLPTGYTTHRLATTDFRECIRNAKRLYAFLLKHRMPVESKNMHAHFTDALKKDAPKLWGGK